jgi:OHCU decarboxylase
MTLDELNTLEPASADAEFRRCAGSTRWAAGLTAARPFRSLNDLRRRGDVMWASLGTHDWLEAFAAHPKIGDQGPGSAWSSAEQSGMTSASDHTRVRLAALNAEYEARFGYIFIVCATGKAPDELLARIEARIANDPATELPIAAEEQRQITRLRLAKLLGANQ